MNIFVLFGQTATGKTAKAIELCEKYDGEIVNFDSRQTYKKLDIVTGKDVPEKSKFEIKIKIKDNTIGYYTLPPTTYNLSTSTRIWLYDIVDPKTSFSSADYVTCAEPVIADILSRGKTPILVGGTGHYLRHIIFGIPEIKVEENWDLRAKLNTKSVEELQNILKESNKDLFESMNESDRANPRRLIRRIEISQSGLSALPTQSTKETLSARIRDLKGRALGPLSITYFPFFHASQEIARQKIELRVEDRLKQGALNEVENLLKSGYTKDDPGLNAIGYNELISCINEGTPLEKAKELWATHEVQYAKRQKTYFAKYFVTSL